MTTKEYHDKKAMYWRLYKDGELTLQQYHDAVFSMLETRLNEALATDGPVSGICMAFNFLRSECVREELQPFFSDTYKAWLETEGVPAEVLNMDFGNGER